MSKSSKTRQSEFRAKQKRADKERKSALYASFRAAGTNKKSKRNKLKSKRSRAINTSSHPSGACGNHGCSRCVGLGTNVQYARAPKPYTTSKEKLAFNSQKIAARHQLLTDNRKRKSASC